MGGLEREVSERVEINSTDQWIEIEIEYIIEINRNI